MNEQKVTETQEEVEELDLRNLDIVTEVVAKAAGVDFFEPFEIWTFTITMMI